MSVSVSVRGKRGNNIKFHGRSTHTRTGVGGEDREDREDREWRESPSNHSFTISKRDVISITSFSFSYLCARVPPLR